MLCSPRVVVNMASQRGLPGVLFVAVWTRIHREVIDGWNEQVEKSQERLQNC